MLGVVDLHLLLEFLHLRSSARARARSGSGARARAGASPGAGAKARASPGPANAYADNAANAPADTYEVPGMWREAPPTAPIA